MPHFVVSLGDVQEGRRSLCLVLKALQNHNEYSVHMMYRGMARSKAKLVAWKEVGQVHIGLESFQE